MREDLIRANLNLVALLQNIEDLVAFDGETADLSKTWDTAVQFAILGGARSHLVFQQGNCRFGTGRVERPGIYLLFLSPGHCNRVFEGRGQPIPLKGLTKIAFLTRELPRLFERLEYYLRPTDQLLEKEDYLALNTRMTLNTAAYGAAVLARLDPLAGFNAGHIRDGTVVMRVEDGPAANMVFEGGRIEVRKGTAPGPMAEIVFRDTGIANGFLNGRIDTFAAVASGEVLLRGQIPMIQHLGLILDRLPVYLQ